MVGAATIIPLACMVCAVVWRLRGWPDPVADLIVRRRTTFMSLIQKFFIRILPQRWAESMETHSRSWMVRCSCGFARSVWELGGIRWKAAGRPRTFPRIFIKCPQCGQRSWHKVSRDPQAASPPPKP
jgi:hypothetical protein